MPQTSIVLPFADGSYEFRVGLAQIAEIQSRCGTGIGAVYARLLKGRFFKVTPAGEIAIGDPTQAEYRVEDIVTVIRQGLIGGARGTVDGEEVRVGTERAGELIERYVLGPDCPLKDSWALATAILTALIEGYEPPEPAPAEDKKKEPEAETAP